MHLIGPQVNYPRNSKIVLKFKAPMGVKILFYMESELYTILYLSEFYFLDKVYPIKIGCCVFKLWLADVRQMTKNYDAFCCFLFFYTLKNSYVFLCFSRGYI